MTTAMGKRTMLPCKTVHRSITALVTFYGMWKMDFPFSAPKKFTAEFKKCLKRQKFMSMDTRISYLPF